LQQEETDSRRRGGDFLFARRHGTRAKGALNFGERASGNVTAFPTTALIGPQSGSGYGLSG